MRTGQCEPGDEIDVGLCYPKCRTGFDGVGPVCWGKAPIVLNKDGSETKFENCGMGAAKDSVTCGIIIANQVASPFLVVANIVSAGAAGKAAQAGFAAAKATAAAAAKGAAKAAAKAAGKIGGKAASQLGQAASYVGKGISKLGTKIGNSKLGTKIGNSKFGQAVADAGHWAKSKITGSGKAATKADEIQDSGKGMSTIAEMGSKVKEFATQAFTKCMADGPKFSGDLNYKSKCMKIKAAGSAILTASTKPTDTDKARAAMTAIGMVDPTGLVDCAAAYTYPKCDEAGYALRFPD